MIISSVLSLPPSSRPPSSTSIPASKRRKRTATEAIDVDAESLHSSSTFPLPGSPASKRRKTSAAEVIDVDAESVSSPSSLRSLLPFVGKRGSEMSSLAASSAAASAPSASSSATPAHIGKKRSAPPRPSLSPVPSDIVSSSRTAVASPTSPPSAPHRLFRRTTPFVAQPPPSPSAVASSSRPVKIHPRGPPKKPFVRERQSGPKKLYVRKKPAHLTGAQRRNFAHDLDVAFPTDEAMEESAKKFDKVHLGIFAKKTVEMTDGDEGMDTDPLSMGAKDAWVGLKERSMELSTNAEFSELPEKVASTIHHPVEDPKRPPRQTFFRDDRLAEARRCRIAEDRPPSAHKTTIPADEARLSLCVDAFLTKYPKFKKCGDITQVLLDADIDCGMILKYDADRLRGVVPTFTIGAADKFKKFSVQWLQEHPE